MGRPEGIIIGGGAAGLMAAITAAENGAGVTILEHMPRVGKKILSTGNRKVQSDQPGYETGLLPLRGPRISP